MVSVQREQAPRFLLEKLRRLVASCVGCALADADLEPREPVAADRRGAGVVVWHREHGCCQQRAVCAAA